MKYDFQFVACCLLLLLAIVYVVRSVRKSFKASHDCPDCGVADTMNKSQKKIKTTKPATGLGQAPKP